MKEQELTNLGFAKINISAEESGGNAFYYFDLDITRYTSLISNSNDEALKNEWQVEFFQDDSVVFYRYKRFTIIHRHYKKKYKMKDLKITAPQGYEIDKDKSTFENIVFKKLNELPKTWENLKQINGFYTTTMSLINVVLITVIPNRSNPTGRNVFKTEEQARASLALAQLSQLRDVYRSGWVPDWDGYECKFCIFFSRKHY